MKHRRIYALMARALALAGCDDRPTSSEDPASLSSCEAETGSVQVDVSVGTSVVFDWNPRCPVAMLLVEEDASDMWGISTDEATWNRPEDANRIDPAITYGTSQPGVSQFQDAQRLVTGVTYELILWRVLPEGSTAQCQQRFGNLCLLAVQPFTR